MPGRRARWTTITERKIGELAIRKPSLAGCVRLMRRCGSEFPSAEILPSATPLSSRAVNVADFYTSRTPFNTEEGTFKVSHNWALQRGVTRDNFFDKAFSVYRAQDG